MGQSKATVPFAGRPLICRLVERLSPVADELIITTNEADRLGFLADLYPDLDIKLVGDAYKERGALPGLYTRSPPPRTRTWPSWPATWSSLAPA